MTSKLFTQSGAQSPGDRSLCFGNFPHQKTQSPGNRSSPIRVTRLEDSDAAQTRQTNQLSFPDVMLHDIEVVHPIGSAESRRPVTLLWEFPPSKTQSSGNRSSPIRVTRLEDSDAAPTRQTNQLSFPDVMLHEVEVVLPIGSAESRRPVTLLWEFPQSRNAESQKPVTLRWEFPPSKMQVRKTGDSALGLREITKAFL